MSHHRIAQYDLPASMCREIGRLLVRFAYVENYLQGIVYMLIGCDQGIGRLAVREPRATERLDLIRDLIAAKKLKEPDLDFKSLRNALDDAEAMRNLCAHGAWTWLEEDNAWAVRVARGSWAQIPKTDRARRNKRIFPGGQIIRHQTLLTYVKGMDGLIDKLRALQTNLEAQLQSLP